MTDKPDPCWTYHVAYATPVGFGDMEIFFSEQISSRDHINTVRKTIATDVGIPQVTVISFQLLAGPASAAERPEADNYLLPADEHHFDTSCDDRPGCTIPQHHAMEDMR